MAFWDANLTYKVGLKKFDPKLYRNFSGQLFGLKIFFKAENVTPRHDIDPT